MSRKLENEMEQQEAFHFCWMETKMVYYLNGVRLFWLSIQSSSRSHHTRNTKCQHVDTRNKKGNRALSLIAKGIEYKCK